MRSEPTEIIIDPIGKMQSILDWSKLLTYEITKDDVGGILLCITNFCEVTCSHQDQEVLNDRSIYIRYGWSHR